MVRTHVGLAIVIGLIGCGTSDESLSGAPNDCQSEQLNFVTDLDSATSGSGTVELDNLSFVNKLGSDAGQLTVSSSGGSDQIAIEFDTLIPDGGSAPARGTVNLLEAGVALGNCETSPQVGTLGMDSDGNGWRFVLEDLRPSPFCDSAPVAGTFSACYRERSD